MDEIEFEKEVKKILYENEDYRKRALADILEFGYYIEKDDKRIEPLTEEWWRTLNNINPNQK